MDAAKRLFRKHLISSMLILLTFVFANVILLLGILFITRGNSEDTVMPISQIAGHIKVDINGSNQWNVSAEDEVSILLSKKNAWAMVLDDYGAVIWETSMPEELPRQYTAPDIARFSRWYLDDYPVLVQTLPMGLLVIGCPPNSITKLNYATDDGSISALIYGTAFIIIVNILLVLLLFWHNTRKVEKAVVPILRGIDNIAQGKSVLLSETEELAEINMELNRAGQHLIKKDKARADWINGVSHDVRTPLSIMLGYAGEIEDSLTLPQTTRETAGIIRKQGEKLRRLIADLNLVSRLEYSMQPLNLSTIYPVELSRQIISEFLNNGLEDRYQIDIDISPALYAVTMSGDCSLISRMLGNLIQNSISHNPGGCRIFLTVRKAASGCEFTVTDDGAGLSKKQLEQLNAGVFAETDYKANGEIAHGLGLQLVQQIVKAHGGRVAYANIPGSGLSVNLFFPS